MVTKQQYVEYLICTIGNYTGSHLAEHLDEVSHDVVTDYLRNEHLTARGIGIVNLVQSAGDKQDFYPIDYRIYAPDQDGKTKNEHFSEMVIHAVYAKKIKAKRILFDSWYASAENLKLVHRFGLIFFTTLKSNRMVSLSKAGGWIHLDQIEWTTERLRNGVIIKLKEVPFKVQLFKVVATDGDIDWVVTNGSDETLTTHAAQAANAVRWQSETILQRKPRLAHRDHY